MTNVIISDLVSLRERGKWWGYIGLMWCFGALLGPVLGGLLSENGQWRGIFWLNMPFCGVGLVGVPWALRLVRKEGEDSVEGMWRRVKNEFDWVGSVLFVASLTGVLIPLSWGEFLFSSLVLSLRGDEC